MSGKPKRPARNERDGAAELDRDDASCNQTERLFRLLAENTRDVVYLFRVVEPQGYEYVSPASLEMLGYPPEEWLADPNFMVNVVHPDDRSKLRGLDEPWGSNSRLMDIRVRAKDGTEKWVELQRTPIYDGDGRLVAVQGVSRDITERKRAAEALRQSEQRFRLLAENAQDMIYRFRMEEPGGYEYVSSGVFRILGYTPEELYADPELFRKSVHPDSASSGDEQMSLQATDDFVVGPPIKRVHKSGKIVWTESRTTLIRDTAAVPVAFEGVVRDVTERAEADEALRRSEERFRLLAEHSHDLIFRYRFAPDVSCEYVSPACERIFGFTAEEFRRDPQLILKATHPDSRAEYWRGLKALGAGEPVTMTLRCRRRDGQEVWVETLAVPVFDDNDEPVAAEGITRDVTERRRVEEALLESERNLRLLADNSKDLIYRARVGPPLTMEYMSSAVVALTGYSQAEFYENPGLLGTIVHPQDRPALEAARHSAAASGCTTRIRIFHKSGDVRWLEMTRNSVTDASGKVVAIEGIGRDVTDRVEAEETLRRSEERFRLLADNANDWIFRFNVTEPRGLVYSSPVRQVITGYTPDEFCVDKQLAFTIVHPDDRALVEALPDDREGFAKPLTYRLLKKNGEWRRVELLRTPIYDDDGNLVAIEGTTRDVTERVEADEALRRSEERFRLLADNARDFVYRIGVADPWRFEYASPACEQIYGYTQEEVYRDPRIILRAIHPEDRAALPGAGEPWDSMTKTMMMRVRHKDGSERWVEVQRAPIFGDDGALVAVEGLVRDVTERKRAEEALLESERNFRLLADHAQDMVWRRRREPAQYEYVSPAVAEMTGYSLREWYADPDLGRTIVHPEDWRLVNAELTRKHHGGRSSIVRWIRKDGRVIWVEARWISVEDDDGNVVATQGIARDVTERVRAAEELKRAKETAEWNNRQLLDANRSMEQATFLANEMVVKAELASAAKSEFLANMSHEIRTPMNGIIGMTSLALDTALTLEQRECLDAVRTSADSLLTVINDILDFSKIEAKQLELRSAGFGLREMLGDVFKGLRFGAHEKGLELAYRVEPEAPDALIGDPDRLRQIVINLVGNAIKFTPKGEVSVRVRAERPSQSKVQLRFAISDTGIGIPPESRSTILQPFTQADSSHTRTHGGTGLGLAICSHLVEMMNGKIWFESEVGQGTTFHFTALLEADALAPALSPVGSYRVLLVDDNATAREMLREMLEELGLSPVNCLSGRTAMGEMEHAAQAGEPFDLVVIDSDMPAMSGFTLAKKIIAGDAGSSPAVVMMTPGHRPGDAARCDSLGVAARLVKPCTVAELAQAINVAVGPKSGERDAVGATSPVRRDRRRRLKILLAEDDPVSRKLASRVMERQGHDVTHVADGASVLAALEQQDFDVIVMDVQMQDMDGLQLTATIRKRERLGGKRVSIVALTAHSAASYRQRCLDAGMDDYLSKPLQVDQLNRALDRQSSARAA